MIRIHASCVDISGTGVLILGPSGSGKSDLALRLIGPGARLVADDQVFLYPEAGRLYAFPPALLKGKLEVRGVGIRDVSHRAVSPVGCVIDLIGAGETERMPDPVEIELAGVRLPCHRLYPFEAAAARKVAMIARLIRSPFKR